MDNKTIDSNWVDTHILHMRVFDISYIYMNDLYVLI